MFCEVQQHDVSLQRFYRVSGEAQSDAHEKKTSTPVGERKSLLQNVSIISASTINDTVSTTLFNASVAKSRVSESDDVIEKLSAASSRSLQYLGGCKVSNHSFVTYSNISTCHVYVLRTH